MDQDGRHASSYEAMDKELGEQKMLDPEDFHNDEIDDNSVLTYVTSRSATCRRSTRWRSWR